MSIASTNAQLARDNLRGIVYMILAMAGFALEDMFVKLSAAEVPTGQILILLGLAGTAVFALMARREGKRLWTADALHPAIVLRNIGEIVGAVGFVTALAMIPLSTVVALFQAMPLFVTLGAALFLGESVGWRRWTAILVGFAGVLVILRPGTDGFQPAALWAVLSVVGAGVRDLATRRVPATISSSQISAWGFLATVFPGIVMLALSGGAVMPTAMQSGYLLGAMIAGMAAYWILIEAMRLGEVATITPFRYTRLLFGLTIGAVVFAERPDATTLAGAGLILAAGLYTLAREGRRNRALSMTADPR